MIRTKNRFLDALLKLLLFSASVHMILLIVYVFYTGNIVDLNYFNLLDIELLIPAIIEGVRMQFLAGLSALLIYLLFFFDFF